MNRVIRTINDLRGGDRVHMTDGSRLAGAVRVTDGAIVTVDWDNGDYSHFHKSDGFTLFTPGEVTI
jgi:hypothetical protein